jgi:orotidine-5'-phosphate decarboxylase
VQNPIIAALDVADANRAVELAEQLSPQVGAVKIGKELFTAAGPEVVRRLRETGARVFLDLKFHDIPNTVAGAVKAATCLGVQMLTLHTAGGAAMMRAAVEAAGEAAQHAGLEAPLLLGVTVLTSMDATALEETGVSGPLEAQVERLAKLAIQSGLRGLVCSPWELRLLRGVLPAEVQLVTPGIRPASAALGDQKRVMTPAEATAAGADWLVIGRPITAAPNPASAARDILAEIQAG